MLESEFYPEIHPVDMLVDLVISDDLDPWNIDLNQISERFLEQVRQMAKINLRLSGRTLLASSILLRMKSEKLLPSQEDIEEEPIFFEFLDGEGFEYYDETKATGLPIPLKRREERKTSIFELVDALQKALGEEILRKNFPRKRKEDEKMVIAVDEEGIKEKIDKVYEKLVALSKIFEVIRFTDLFTVDNSRLDVVDILLALLYLDNQERIKVWQKSLFGDIFITLV